MRETARDLARYGRHGDDMLLHVSRKELEGIRALTGKDFTRNPDTGLPEAFNFSSLIPIAAGIAGTVLTGNPAVGAMAAGAASAGTTAAQGGTAQEALTQGLISGATSFAGGQILSGVGAAAGEAAGGAAGTAVPGSVAGPSLAPGGITGELLSPLPGVAEAGTGYNAIAPMTGAAPSAPSFSVPPMASTTGIAGPAGDPGFMGQTALPVQPAAPTAPGLGDTMATRAADFGTRLSNIASDPGAALSQLGTNISNNKMAAAIAGGGTLMQAGNMFGQPQIPGEPEYDPNKYPEQFPTNPRRFTAPPAGYRPGAGPEYRYFAEGGLASVRKDEGYTANLMNEAKAALLGEHPRPREAIMRFREAFGDDALNLLRDRISPGRVRGAGGGMDDLVPGSIEGRQKVRLADGEFVVPADVVSGLGDGSTDQGVRKLHGLMDKVRQQRTGMKAQPKAIGGKITL